MSVQVMYMYIAAAGGHSGLSIVAKIEQFYKDVQQRRRERIHGCEPQFDTRY